MARSTHHKHTCMPFCRWRKTTGSNRSLFTAFSMAETRRHLRRQLTSVRCKERWQTSAAAQLPQLLAAITPWTATSDGKELAEHTNCSCTVLANISRILLL